MAAVTGGAPGSSTSAGSLMTGELNSRALDQRREAALLAEFPPDKIKVPLPAVGPVSRRNTMCPDCYKAAASGDIDRLNQLLNPNEDSAPGGVHSQCRLSEVTTEGNTVLHLAADLGHKEMAEKIYSRERSLLMAENTKADTPLHCAARAGHDSVVSALLQLAREHGVEAKEVLMKRNRLGDTVLHEAVRNQHESVAETLLNEVSDLATIDNKNGVSPLYLAVINGSASLVKSLTRRCDHASFSGPNGLTALHSAVFSDREIASVLLEWKPTIAQLVDASQSTPLHYAASGDDTEMVEKLLDASTTAAYSKDNEGFSPIHVAARVGKVKTIELLLERCPDSAELLDNEGRNFLHLAAGRNKLKVVEYVLARRNKMLEKLINEQDFYGNTPLHSAIKSGNEKIVMVLTSEGKSKSSIMNNQGQTPLELAIETRKTYLILWFPRSFITSGATLRVRRLDLVDFNQTDKVYEIYHSLSGKMMIVATVIATVAFSATFNLPGGYDSSGKAMLHGKPEFKIFIALDSMAMALSLLSLFLLIPKKFYPPFPGLHLVLSIWALWLAILFMSMAFIVAAISAGTGRGFAFLACVFFLPSTVSFIDLEFLRVFLKSLAAQARRPWIRSDVRHALDCAFHQFWFIQFLMRVTYLLWFTDVLVVGFIALTFSL